jgi:hypothetical protein
VLKRNVPFRLWHYKMGPICLVIYGFTVLKVQISLVYIKFILISLLIVHKTASARFVCQDMLCAI